MSEQGVTISMNINALSLLATALSYYMTASNKNTPQNQRLLEELTSHIVYLECQKMEKEAPLGY